MSFLRALPVVLLVAAATATPVLAQDPRVAGLFSKKFMDDTFGVLVSVAYSERQVREEGYNTVRWGDCSASVRLTAPKPAPTSSTR